MESISFIFGDLSCQLGDVYCAARACQYMLEMLLVTLSMHTIHIFQKDSGALKYGRPESATLTLSGYCAADVRFNM
jgi:hypothetical protein